MKNFYWFIVLVFFYLFTGKVSQNLLSFYELQIEFISGQFGADQLDNFLKYRVKWIWLSYFLIPFQRTNQLKLPQQKKRSAIHLYLQ